MEARSNFASVSPDAYRRMTALQEYVNGCGLEHSLIELVKLRASQINGCGFCIDMHSKDALEAGETPQRLLGLDAWRECPYYSDRERGPALAWTEAVTRIAESHAPDAAHDEAEAHFTEKELVDLTWAIAAINSWNRMAVSFRAVPGSYKPAGVGV